MATPKFTPATDIDPNAWYHISEERVDKTNWTTLTNSLQIRDKAAGELVVWLDNGHRWQVQPVGNDQYALRCGEAGVSKQLSVCYAPDEFSSTKTQPCLADSHGGDEQKWMIADWGLPDNPVYRFINVKNGSDYWMDVHQGNPIFMSPDIKTDFYRPAQRWLMRSGDAINDESYSTTFTNLPTAAASEASGVATRNSSGSDNSNHTNVGLAVGVGIAVAILIIAAALGAYFLWLKYRRVKSAAPLELKDAPYEPYSHFPPGSSWSNQPNLAGVYDGAAQQKAGMPYAQDSQFSQNTYHAQQAQYAQHPYGQQPQYTQPPEQHQYTQPSQQSQQAPLYPQEYYNKLNNTTHEMDDPRLKTHELHNRSYAAELNS
jgi:hypothetical protein